MRSGITLAIAFVLSVLFLGLPLRADASNQNLIIATATTGGTFYPVGVGIGSIVTINLAKSHHITATAVTSAGSSENVDLLHNKECDFALVQALMGHNAIKGIEQYAGKPHDNLRGVTMVWENVEHFVLKEEYVREGTIADLKGLGKPYGNGKRNSGTAVSGLMLMKLMGIVPGEDVHLQSLGYSTSSHSIVSDKVAGANLPAGPPVVAVEALYRQLGAYGVRVLEFTDSQLATIQSKYPIWNRYVIPAGTYSGQVKPIRTIAQPNFLACRAGLPENTVYQITKTIYENLPFLHKIHKVTRGMSLKKATVGLPVPLHPGAEKYYREMGIIK